MPIPLVVTKRYEGQRVTSCGSRLLESPLLAPLTPSADPGIGLSGDRVKESNGLLERVGTGIVGTIGYVVLPTGMSTDVSRDIV